MSQRLRRSRDRKNQEGSTMATGGQIVHYNRGMDPVIRVPQKTTGDVPAEQAAGLAKASPFFKKMAEVMPKSKAEEKKVVAEAIEPVKKPAEEIVPLAEQDDDQEAE